jgi:TPR repeat protein
VLKRVLAGLITQAELGNAGAQHHLGVMYEYGKGVPQDFAEAVAWYRKAAEQGYVIAQTSLGWMFANSQGVPQDHIRAYMWFKLATAHGDKDIAHVSGRMRDKVAKRMTPNQLAEALRLAREWKPRPAPAATTTPAPATNTTQ